MYKKLLKFLKNPLWIIVFLNNHGLHILNDRYYLKLIYRLEFQRKLNLNNPISYNEKIQWLKLNDRKDEYTKLVDKLAVKEYVSNLIGEEYIIPTIGVYEKFNDIDFSALPNQFVIKCTHDSGGIVICKNKQELNLSKTRRKINKCLKKNFYYINREWPYKNIKPVIIIEKYMEDKETKELRDYKFFCFKGEPKLMFLATDRQKGNTKFNFYDLDFNLLPFQQGHPNDLRNIEKPKNFSKMIELAKILSKNIPHIRVDFYEINGKVYFGELTFYHYSGLTKFEPEEWDNKLGSMIDLNK